MKRRTGVSLAASCAVALATFVAQAAGAPAPARSTLPNSASPEAATTADLGSLPAATPVAFQVVLPMTNAAGARAFAQAVSTPGNAAYHHFLTAGQWETHFSPTVAQVAEVEAFLEASGFRVTAVSADRLAVAASGTAAQVESAFSTSLSYHLVHGVKLRLADQDLSVPAALSHTVIGVLGVSQAMVHPQNTTDAPTPSQAAVPALGSPQPPPPGFRVAPPCGAFFGQLIDTILPPYGNGYPATPPWAVCGYVPSQLRSAYSEPAGLTGKGVTVAITDAYASPTILSDAQTYAARNDPSHPLSSSQFSQIVPSSFTDGDLCGASSWYGEETLDVEAVHAMAPDANILFVGATSCFDALFTAVQNIVDGHLANVITDSWGDPAGDVLDDPGVRTAFDDVAIMAAGTGISLMFGSGDSGDEFTTVGASIPDYPPSSPWVTAVGGTTTEIGQDGTIAAQYAWSTARSFLCNDTYLALGGCTDGQLGTWTPFSEALDGTSGGGTSYVYPQPSYQAGVVPAALSEKNAAVIGTHDPTRVVPDISMDADPATGFLVGETQTFPTGVFYDQYRIGGTSLASPLFAGLIALADQANGGPLGFLNPTLYSLSNDRAAITDILPSGKQDMSRADYANSLGPGDGLLFSTRLVGYQGQEAFCPTDDPAKCVFQDLSIPALPGYDAITGLGAPGANFIARSTGK